MSSVPTSTPRASGPTAFAGVLGGGATPLDEVLGDTLIRVQKRIVAQLRSDLPPLDRLCKQVERYHGKMVRPCVTVLSGLAAGGGATVNESQIVAAAVCEMIHIATLVHDDILDEAEVRRSAPTINSLHGNESAVILGDYLFSSAFHLCSQLDTQAASLLVAETGMTLCAGELLQLHHRGNFSLDEETYYAIVKRKTASLIAVACQLGARLASRDAGDGAIRAVCVDTSADIQKRFYDFGMALGIAFQIQDDLLDVTGEQSVVGKSLGKDMEKGKLTLPLIHHLASATPEQRGRTLLMLESAERSPASGRVALARALDATGSIAHARHKAEEFVTTAKAALEPLPESPAREMLLRLAEAVVTRAF